MSNENQSILIVDDDPELLEFLSVVLSAADFTSLKAKSGKEALSILEKNEGNIQAILSDVNMPDIDGYELCKTIRADQRFQSLPFIFISAHTDLDEKLTGYSAGADDYIAKPILEPQELITKTRYCIENKLQHITLSKQLSESFQTTMQAMTYSSHLGAVLLFLQDASHLTNFTDMANRLLETTENFGMNAVVKFTTMKGDLSFRKNGAVTPIEVNIMDLARKKSRFFDFEARTIISYENFSLLIKNMPVDNPETYGTMKDVLGNLCNAIETITEILLAKELNQHKNDTMTSVNLALNDIKTTITEIQDENTNVIEDMISDVDEAMLTLGLTDLQEENIRTITQNCLMNSRKVLQKADVLKEAFNKVHHNLESETK